MPSRIFFGYRIPAAGGGPSFGSLTLTNSLATFVFTEHATTGMYLSSFQRAGGHVWTNHNTSLWSATVYDTTTAPTTTTATITPLAVDLSMPAIVTDAQGQYISAQWTSIAVGADSLNVTLTLRLNDDEDFLRVRVSATWASAATYTLDAIGCLGLQIDPFHQGADFAAVPFGFGILSEDPVQNLRYANGVAGFPATGFQTQTTNRWRYPTGRGWTMGCWGYYEQTTSEAWMVHLLDWSLEYFECTFEGDGTYLNWSMSQAQQDNVLIGNNSRSLGSAYTFCLRPFAVSQSGQGWWDISRFYVDTMEAANPTFLPGKRNVRADYSTAERSHMPFVAIQAIDDSHVPADGKPGNIAMLLTSMRVQTRLPSTTHIVGIVEAPDYSLHLPGETPDGDLNDKLATLWAEGNYFGLWFPAGPVGGSGEIGPDVWDYNRWNGATAGDESELRWWTNNDMVGSMHMSRVGYLQGGGTDRLVEETVPYYRERNYSISAWTGPTLTLSVAGTPSLDGFTGSLYAALIPASGAARQAFSYVTLMGASTVKLWTGFFNSLGATAIPAAGDSVEVYSDVGSPQDPCWHAVVNSTFFTRLKNNTTVGTQNRWKSSGYYLDVFPDPQLGGSSPRTTCYRDHSTWSKINAGYVRHPYGGGDWYKNGLRDYIRGLRQSARDAQMSLGREPFFWISSEDLDECSMDVIDWCWHVISSGALWRVTTGYNPTIHKYKTVPMYGAHAGRTMGRALTQEFSSGLLNSAFYADDELIRFLGFCLASEWPYGLTWPTLDLFENDTIPMGDLWDAAQYADAGGTVPTKVRDIRNLWSQIAYAETNWLLDSGFRYGTMLPPPALDYSRTDTVTGMAQSTWTILAPLYYSYDTVYPRATFPRVVAVPWEDSDQSVKVVCANWTDTTARWAGTVDISHAGYTAGSIVRTRVVDYQNQTVQSSTNQTGSSLALAINEVPAYTIRVIVLDSEPTLPPVTFRPMMIRTRF